MTISKTLREEPDIKQNGEAYFNASLADIQPALYELYGKPQPEISLQQLSATFRRGDLIEKLQNYIF